MGNAVGGASTFDVFPSDIFIFAHVQDNPNSMRFPQGYGNGTIAFNETKPSDTRKKSAAPVSRRLSGAGAVFV
jgi:hypothetical protein